MIPTCHNSYILSFARQNHPHPLMQFGWSFCSLVTVATVTLTSVPSLVKSYHIVSTSNLFVSTTASTDRVHRRRYCRSLQQFPLFVSSTGMNEMNKV
jgi:hypothetical protein